MAGRLPSLFHKMPIALTPDSIFEYQLIEERIPDEDGQRRETSAFDPSGTIFLLGPLSPSDEAILQNKQFSWSPTGELQSYNFGSERLTLLEFGLKGWRNFKDQKGNDVPFRQKKMGNRTVCDVDCLSVLSLRHRNELVAAHRKHFSMTEDEGN